MGRDYNRVKFYSSTDLSCGYYLEKAEVVLRDFSLDADFSEINKAIELFNIREFFLHDLRLARWTVDEFENYKKTSKEFERIIAIFFKKINDEDFLEKYIEVNPIYIEDFWLLINRFKVYENISESSLIKVMDQPNFSLIYLLRQKSLVDYYGQIITNYMLKSVHNAELLLFQYLKLKIGNTGDIYFPRELSEKQKDDIILKYVRSEDVNPNYLLLIAEAQSTKQLTLKDKTKLEAKRRHDLFMESFFKENNGFKFGGEVRFCKTQDEEIISSSDENDFFRITYGIRWIEENQDYPTLLNNFIYLFGYVDSYFRSEFISRPAELGIFEHFFGVKGKKNYETGIQYNIKHMVYNLQMMGYYRCLKNINIRLEEVFKWFFESYLIEEFDANGFIFNIPSSETTVLEKCKILASEIDSILKQFSLYVTEGSIDRELFEISSKHMKLRDIPSFLKEKYIYPKNEICKIGMHLLFSDQSGLSYTDRYGDKYVNFYSLFKNERLYLDDFRDYQKSDIEWLTEYNCIKISDDGILEFNLDKIFILKDLHYNQVSCRKYLNQYNELLRNMIVSNEICYDSSLFSKPEQSYINYILNKAEFSNGFDLGNKYSHGTHSLDEEIHKKDYIELLKITVLIIIKINEEFCLLNI